MMGEFAIGTPLKVGGWIATAAVGAAVILMAVTAVTGSSDS